MTPLWLIGSGPMAQSYSAVLHAQGASFRVIGRSYDSAKKFQNETGIEVHAGGLANALAFEMAPQKAIVAVGIEQLAICAQQLLAAGCKSLLIEKPGALTHAELQLLQTTVQEKGANVYIAYNRRFYASVQKLRKLVAADGGITSAVFEFTEWSHRVKNLQKAPGVKEHWLLANSTHVLDLVFSLIGNPADGQWQAWHGGSLDWHPAAARFHGAGISQRGIPFSYHSDWEAPGSWGIELLTRKNRYVMRPMEKLQVVPLGSLNVEPIYFEDSLDNKFKPGLFEQCDTFLKSDHTTNNSIYLCSLKEQLEAFPIYQRIAGYSS